MYNGSGHHRRWQKSSSPCKFPSPQSLLLLRLGLSDPTICGKYEKLLSNNCDIVSVHCVVGEYTLTVQVACNMYI